MAAFSPSDAENQVRARAGQSGPAGLMAPPAGGAALSDKELGLGSVVVPLREIRAVTTERADTLQVATRDLMWQFRPAEGSAFRLFAWLQAWQADHRS